ncbi:MAG: hypothetical protein WDO16_21050 [Bacteroidota bacterium]
MEKLLSNFLVRDASPDEISQIAESFKFKKIAKGHYFVEEGKTSKYLAFISKGLFQYFYARDGKEITLISPVTIHSSLH